MADRYAVPFQAFITNGAVITSDVTGRVAAAGNTTLTLSTTGGAGTFTITLGSGCTGTVTSGSATITGSVLALVAGANTVTSNGAGTCTLNLTLGTAVNTNDVNTWSAATGGVSGASVPTSADNTYFNANSFTAASQVLTVNAAVNCLDMTWTGATNTPTLTINASTALSYYGNVVLIAAMVSTGATGAFLCAGSGAQTFTSNGLTLAGRFYVLGATGTLTLQDALTTTNTEASGIYQSTGTFNTNGMTVTTAGGIYIATATAKTLTLGASVINCTAWNYAGSNLTLNANTSSIRVTGTGAFAGGGKTYNEVQLNGTAHTISGDNIIPTLKVGRTAAVAITGTAGMVLTARHLVVPNNRNILTINSTGAAWTITGNTGVFESNYLSLTNVVAAWPNIYYAGDHSTDGTGNTNWIFKRKVRVWR